MPAITPLPPIAYCPWCGAYLARHAQTTDASCCDEMQLHGADLVELARRPVLTCNVRSATPGHDCRNPAAYRYTWPGREPAYVCAIHVERLRDHADAAGVDLQLART